MLSRLDVYLLLQRMPQIEHNAEKFSYRVYFRKETDPQWIIEDVADWYQKELLVMNQPKFTKYRIKVNIVMHCILLYCIVLYCMIFILYCTVLYDIHIVLYSR